MRSAVGSVSADPARLRQILLNLIDNAVKYAPDGPIDLRVASAGADVHLAVVDHGPGIPEVDRARVFEQFVQLDQSSTRRQGGTGLGLYLCRQVAGLLNGTLTLEPAPGGGCCFTLAIPESSPLAATPTPTDETAIPSGTETTKHAGTGEPPEKQRFGGVRSRPAEFAGPTRQSLLPVE